MGLNLEDIKAAKQLKHKHWGLCVAIIDGHEYAWGSARQCEAAAVLYCRDSLWAFSAQFIGDFLALSESQIKAIGKMQGELCEDAGEIVKLLIGKRIREFVKEAIAADGRGHYLSQWDGREIMLNAEWYAYRIG